MTGNTRNPPTRTSSLGTTNFLWWALVSITLFSVTINVVLFPFSNVSNTTIRAREVKEDYITKKARPPTKFKNVIVDITTKRHVGKDVRGTEGLKEIKEPANRPPKALREAIPPKETTAAAPPSPNDESHQIAGLSCQKHGGPNSGTATEEMVYWSDIPSDSSYQSPFHDPNDQKYLTFEPDGGGWNNIRMAMETIVVLAHSMGRTLVLPPEAKMYLLDKKPQNQKSSFSFHDFFHLDTISEEHEGLDIITMEEFLRREAITENLKTEGGDVMKPPSDLVNWDGKEARPLWNYLRMVGHVNIDWKPDKCIAAFPATTDPEDVTKLERAIDEMNEITPKVEPNQLAGKSIPVDAPLLNRLIDSHGGRYKLCIYDEEMQVPKLLHFKVDHGDRARMLTHFYGFVFFMDWRQDLWAKRFVRDHMRYTDEIVCAAARIVEAVRERVRTTTEVESGEYDSMHVRRGDFQYKKTRLTAQELYENSKEQLEEKFTIYIASDERNKSFFDPLRKHYNLLFLDDFAHLLEGVNTNYYGMLDQLVASRGRRFFGTFFSTLTGYINRMRGYHSDKEKLEGHEQGVIQSWYFTPQDRKYEMQQYMPVRLPLYMREFPTSWRNIDFGVGQMGR